MIVAQSRVVESKKADTMGRYLGGRIGDIGG